MCTSVRVRVCACVRAFAYRTEKDLGTDKSASVISSLGEMKELNGAPKN